MKSSVLAIDGSVISRALVAQTLDGAGFDGTTAVDGQDEDTRQLRDVGKQIEMLLERIIEAVHASVIKACESKIAKLEREKLLLAYFVEELFLDRGLNC